jgi:hypothetical protein
MHGETVKKKLNFACFAINCLYLYLHSMNVFINSSLCTFYIFCADSVTGTWAVESAHKLTRLHWIEVNWIIITLPNL